MSEEEKLLELLFYYAVKHNEELSLQSLDMAKPFMEELYKPGYNSAHTQHAFEGFKLAVRNLDYLNAHFPVALRQTKGVNKPCQ